MDRHEKITLIREFLYSLSKTETISINPDYINKMEVINQGGHTMMIEGKDIKYLRNPKFLSVIDKLSQQVRVMVDLQKIEEEVSIVLDNM